MHICMYSIIGISLYVTYFIYTSFIYNTTLILYVSKQSIKTNQHYKMQ